MAKPARNVSGRGDGRPTACACGPEQVCNARAAPRRTHQQIGHRKRHFVHLQHSQECRGGEWGMYVYVIYTHEQVRHHHCVAPSHGLPAAPPVPPTFSKHHSATPQTTHLRRVELLNVAQDLDVVVLHKVYCHALVAVRGRGEMGCTPRCPSTATVQCLLSDAHAAWPHTPCGQTAPSGRCGGCTARGCWAGHS